MVGDFNYLYDEGESVVLDLSTVLGTVPLPFQGRTKTLCPPYIFSLFFISR